MTSKIDEQYRAAWRQREALRRGDSSIPRAAAPAAAFVVNIACHNDAFQPDCGPELARILRDLALRVETAPEMECQFWAVQLHDRNGNHIGQASIVRAER